MLDCTDALALTDAPTARRPPHATETTSAREIDEAFTDLPLRRLADAALSRARALGAEHADFRVERIQRLST